MENDAPQKPEITNFLLLTPPGTPQLDMFIGNNLITGPFLLGDRIRDKASGLEFVVAERIWLSGKDRQANLMIRLDPAPAK